MNKRILKNDNYKSNEISTINPKSQIIHPVISTLIYNEKNKPLCLTKTHLKNNNIVFTKDYKCNFSENNYKKYLFVPPIGISSNDILEIYNIDSIDSLKSFIDESLNDIDPINKYKIFTVNRILNSWIRNNFSTLKLYNNFLEKIYFKLINLIIDFNKINIDNDELIKNIKYFIDYWINKNNDNNFKFNLLEDMINYFLKKYK